MSLQALNSWPLGSKPKRLPICYESRQMGCVDIVKNERSEIMRYKRTHGFLVDCFNTVHKINRHLQQEKKNLFCLHTMPPSPVSLFQVHFWRLSLPLRDPNVKMRKSFETGEWGMIRCTDGELIRRHGINLPEQKISVEQEKGTL